MPSLVQFIVTTLFLVPAFIVSQLILPSLESQEELIESKPEANMVELNTGSNNNKEHDSEQESTEDIA